MPHYAVERATSHVLIRKQRHKWQISGVEEGGGGKRGERGEIGEPAGEVRAGPGRTPGNRYVCFLQGYFGCALGRADGRVYSLAELGRANQEQVLLLVGGYEDVVLVLPLFTTAVFEGGHPIAVLPEGGCRHWNLSTDKCIIFGDSWYITLSRQVKLIL